MKTSIKRNKTSPRNTILLDMYAGSEFIFNESLSAIRSGLFVHYLNAFFCITQ
jgi:hypothetical protein